MNKDLQPGLGSGALREAGDIAHDIVRHWRARWAGHTRIAAIKSLESAIIAQIELDRAALLSLSSPIEPGPDSRLLDELTKLLSDTELVIHAPSQEWNSRWTDATHKLYERRENPKWAQASSEIRERPNLLSSIPLATGRDSITNGWTVDPTFLLEVRELLSGDECPDLEAIEAVVLALNQLQTKRALALSRQGAGGK